MSIALFSMSEPTIAETSKGTPKNSKPPKSRTVVAKADPRSTPEAR